MKLVINQPVWYPEAKKKAIVKEILKDDKVRITYFDRETDERIVKDVPKEELQAYKKPTHNKYYFMVREFHKAFNHPVADKPTRLSPEQKNNRVKWMQEELNEYVNANTLLDEIDALIDLEYFVQGTLVEHGVKPDAIFEIVHQANMSKLFPDGKPHYNEDGKVIKPPHWKNPEPLIKKEIERQSQE